MTAAPESHGIGRERLLAGLALGSPLSILSILTTPFLFFHAPSHRQLYYAYRWRWLLTGVGVAAGLALFCQSRIENRLSPLGKTIPAGWAGLAEYAAITYDPLLFRPRRSVVGHWSVEAAPASFDQGDTEVIGVWLNGEGRAYSARHVARPHLMRDQLGGETILISLCGLTNSAIVYRAAANGLPDLAVLSAPNNNVIYRNRRSGAPIQQLLSRVAYGPGAGKSLSTLPAIYTDWAKWLQLVPDSQLADQDYVSWGDRLLTRVMRLVHRHTRTIRRPFLAVSGGADRTIHPKALVFALRENGEAFAYTPGYLHNRRIIGERAGYRSFVIFYAPQVDIAAAYRWPVSATEPSFRSCGDMYFEHEQSGKVWDILGRPIGNGGSGGQAAALEPVPFAFDKAFWFSWKYWHDDTQLRRLDHELDRPGL